MVAVEAPKPLTEDVTVLGVVGDYCLQLASHPSEIKDDWEGLQSAGTSCIYQNFDWVRIAIETIDKHETPYIVVGSNHQGVQFILPMVLESGFVKTLRWAGGTHANICSGIFTQDFLKTTDASTMRHVFQIIARSIPGIAVARLSNQLHDLSGHSNPLKYLPSQKSVNLMYDMDLRNGIDRILDMGNGKRKRKLWRKQQRVAETMGGYELVVPETRGEITDAINQFRELKAMRFSELGINDVFAGEEAREFLMNLALEPEKDNIQLFRLLLLKVGGQTRAMYGCAMFGDYCQANVNAVTFDDFSDQSPGEMIMYAMIEYLIENGFKRLDLGVGNERYKFSWCQQSTELFDTIMPLSVLATPIMFGLQAKLRIKGYLRNNSLFWEKYKKFRKLKAQQK